jgi:hypothetical protein
MNRRPSGVRSRTGEQDALTWGAAGCNAPAGDRCAGGIGPCTEVSAHRTDAGTEAATAHATLVRINTFMVHTLAAWP